LASQNLPPGVIIDTPDFTRGGNYGLASFYPGVTIVGVRIGCHTGPVFVLLNVFVPNADEAAGNTRSFRVSVPVVGTSTSLSTELRSTTVSQIRVEVVLQSRLESRPLSVSRLIESAVILSSLD